MFVSSGNEVKIWNSDSNDLITEYAPLNSNIGTIHSFAIRPDNSQIACVFESGCIKFLNFESGFQEDGIDGSESKACCYDSTGRQFAVGTMNSLIEIYDTKTMKKKFWKIKESNTPVNCISWSKTDRNLATGHPNGSIVIFNSVMSNFGKPLYHPKYNDLKSQIVTALQWSFKNPPQLAAGYDDGSVILWDTIKCSTSSIVKAHNSPCTTVLQGLGPTPLLISSCLDGYINLFDCNSNKTVKTIACRSGITSCDLALNGVTMCIGTINGNIQIHDIRQSSNPMTMFKAHETAVHCIKYSQNLPNQSRSTNNSIYNNQTVQIEGQSLIKKSNSYNFDLNQQNTNILNPLASVANPVSLYSPENQKISNKLRAQSSTGNLVNILDNNNSIEINRHKNQMPLSSTTNLNTPNNLMKLDYSKISKERGEIYSPLANGSSINDENTINGSINNHASPYLAPKLSSTKISQAITPKMQSSIKIQLTNTQSEKMVIDSPVNEVVDQPETFIQNLNPLNTNLNGQTNNNNQSLQLEMVREIVNDAIYDLRYEMMSENFKFKAEMFRELLELRKFIEETFKAVSVNDALVSEIQRLKEENKRLKKLY
ncbi:unnamed protein product [Brachionus calyciflorus]|uniref:NEDD1 n=1 Tax=Brachionus calyciflorus TaxID=104777 RepID=A0A814J447_9BILA|nr:unnamed protein product [Brachionus calyciflorus]